MIRIHSHSVSEHRDVPQKTVALLQLLDLGDGDIEAGKTRPARYVLQRSELLDRQQGQT
jgi:hypothetical protein